MTHCNYHYSITHTDQRLGSITKASAEKWNSLFDRCLRKLGFHHNKQQSPSSDNNSLSIWNYWHLVSSQTKASTPPVTHRQFNNVKNFPLKRSNSLPGRFQYSLNKRNPVSPVRESPMKSSELKKTNTERLHHLMKEYLEKVKSHSVCVSSLDQPSMQIKGVCLVGDLI